MTSHYMPKRDEKLQFNGFRSPTTTPVPDEVFDDLIADLTGAELKVLLYICRRTFGFKKDRDSISLNQIANGITTRDDRVLDRGTGLSKRHVQRALKSLELKNVVTVNRRMDEEGENEINIYSLNFINEGRGVGTKSPYRRDKKSPRVGTPVSTTTNSIQQTVNNTVNGGSKLIRNMTNLNIPDEQADYIADYILQEFGDKHSAKFYKLVSQKIPESVIRQALSEIKTDGAKHPAKVFVHRMKEYAMRDARRRLVKSF
jgi:phage replication O-like protein O